MSTQDSRQAHVDKADYWHERRAENKLLVGGVFHPSKYSPSAPYMHRHRHKTEVLEFACTKQSTQQTQEPGLGGAHANAQASNARKALTRTIIEYQRQPRGKHDERLEHHAEHGAGHCNRGLQVHVHAKPKDGTG